MRQKRSKVYRRLVHQYVVHYGFREPFQVLLDDSFAEALGRYKVGDPLRQLGNVLQAKVKPMITQCCMVALYNAEARASSAGNSEALALVRGVVAMAKGWERRRCNHKEALPPRDCLAAVVGPTNQHRYVLAADDAQVRRALRRTVPGLPIVHYSQSVLVLEPMSDVTEQAIREKEDAKSAISPAERAILERASGPQPEARPKRKRAKGPNPLSVKKPKKRDPPKAPSDGPRARDAAAPDAAPAAPDAGPTQTESRRRRKKRGRGGAEAGAAPDGA